MNVPEREIGWRTWAQAIGWLALGIGVPLLAWHGYVRFFSDEAAAFKECRAIVKAKLVSPATAQFSEETYLRLGKWAYIRFEVDAQNRAGALLRQSGECKFSITDGKFDPRWGVITELKAR